MLTLFEALVLSHFIVDWLFQTSWEAVNKSKRIFPLLVHSLVYSTGFIPVFYFFKINYLYLALLFISHAILDNRKFEFWWLEKIKRNKASQLSESMVNILIIATDQIFHVSILAVLVYLI